MAADPANAPARSRATIRPLLITGGVLAAVIAAALTALSTGTAAAGLGLSDSGELTAVGLPVVRAVAEAASVVCIGSLLLAAFLVPPDARGRLGADGFAAVRTAGWAGLVWCVAALLAVPLTVSDSTGQPLGEVLASGTFGELFGALEQPKAWLVTAVLVAVVAVAARFVLAWGPTAALLALALAAWAPIAFTGHSSSGGDHDLAMTSLLVHLVAATLWVGGLAAVLAHARRRGVHLPLVVGRFSALALVAWALMAVTGVVNALVRLPLADLFGTGYGLLVLAKTALLLVLGGFGYLQRTRALPPLRDGRPGALVRFAVWEVLIMFATIGVAAALARTAPPPDPRTPSVTEELVGYPLHGPPTAARLLGDWRFDLLFGTAAVLAALGYLAGVRALRRRGGSWPVRRTVAWLAGCVVLLLATSSGFGRYAPAMFSLHMVGHLLLGTVVALLGCLGAPVTLVLRAVRRGDQPGPREWLLAAVRAPVTRAVTHPVVALVLYAGSPLLLYGTGLFDAAVPQHWALILLDGYLLLVGHLFFWPLVGADPAPRRLPVPARIAVTLAAAAGHALLGVLLLAARTPVGQNFYLSLALPWVDIDADQRLAGVLVWVLGELPLLLVVLALVVWWSRDGDGAAREPGVTAGEPVRLGNPW